MLTPTMVKIRELIEEILMWPSLDGDEGMIWGNFLGTRSTGDLVLRDNCMRVCSCDPFGARHAP